MLNAPVTYTNIRVTTIEAQAFDMAEPVPPDAGHPRTLYEAALCLAIRKSAGYLSTFGFGARLQFRKARPEKDGWTFKFSR